MVSLRAGVMGDELLGSKCTTCTTAINSSNIGFQLLKKHGWKEGTGLGVSEQGRLEPVQAYFKNNKRGLGADKVKKRTPKPLESSISKDQNEKEHSPSKMSKTLSKKQRKMQQLEKHLQEKEFERAFFREFWPDNV
ncbi:G-patch domain-containing protein C1486.03 isoform X2 [Manihot esculenta]|uniref:Uncharacterized protein n=2 Tax=Manihot esculenta TaxID=3983 RepID=A0ACB7HVJ2_MANES|nr:G-patch domain-containing protein C1486.03 isoform X2 [Manihot esculenta]KAG8656662.1 hypothetical protein MANES_04G161100v8 [Manihot esculenta]